MEDLRTQAQLVASDAGRAPKGAIGTVVTRSEIADAAAQGDFPATLLLDLDRVGTADGDAVTAHARVAVDWDKPALEELLASTEDNEIALWFDGRELARAFEERDVEGHGLRERAAVLAIAVTAAGMGAGPSLAASPADTGGGGTPLPAYSINPQAVGHGPAIQPMGAERALQQDENIAAQQPQGSLGGSAAATSSGGGMSSGELAAIAGGIGAVLISAAGFGAARKRMPPAQPA